MNPETLYTHASGAMLFLCLLLPYLLVFCIGRLTKLDKPVSEWFRRQNGLVNLGLSFVIIDVFSVPSFMLYKVGNHNLDLSRFNRFFYGKEMVVRKYIRRENPEQGVFTGFGFTDTAGNEWSISIVDVNKPGPVDRMYLVLKSGQRVRFSQTSYSQGDIRPVPEVIK